MRMKLATLALLAASSMTAQTTDVSMPLFVTQMRTALTELQAQLAARHLPPILQARLEVQAQREPGYVKVLQSNELLQNGTTKQAGLLLAIPTPPGPAPTAASNPLAQALENALLAQAAAFPKNGGNPSKWLAQAVTVNFTLAMGSQDHLSFTVLPSGTKVANGTPVHQLILTFAAPK